MDNCESKGDLASPQPQPMSEKARRLTQEIQEIMTRFQTACKEARTGDISFMVDQVDHLLKQLKDEFSATCPASPIPADSFGSISDEMRRLLQHVHDEQDDATSTLAGLTSLKPECDTPSQQLPDFAAIEVNNFERLEQQEHGFPGSLQCDGPGFTGQSEAFTEADLGFQIDFDFDQFHFKESNGVKLFGHDLVPSPTPQISPPAKAFLSKCALWDCQRPAQGLEWGWDYCSNMHAELALKEGEPGINPVLRPGGIGLNDDRLFDTLDAKLRGKYVGIPECPGAAFEKCPWNVADLFDLSLLEGETLREWLFFDKPKNAFESGTRKQRSLSDYKGRGWHESRKQKMDEQGALKKCYYMDPQPPGRLHWHLYEYEKKNSDETHLYKLELKVVSEEKSSKGSKLAGESGSIRSRKGTKDPLVALQKQMGRLTADGASESKLPVEEDTSGGKNS